VEFYRQKVWNYSITPIHIVKYAKLYSRYVPIQVLIANKFRLLFTYNADSIRDLTRSEVYWRRIALFTVVALNRQCVNNCLDRPLKPGIRNKTEKDECTLEQHLTNSKELKMLCLYLLGSTCLHLTFLPYLNSETYSLKYKKLPNIVIHECKNITEKMYVLKMSNPQIWLSLFTFRSIASKQLNSLTTLDTLSWIGGAVVTHPLWVLDFPGSIPGSGKGFYVWFFVL